MAYVQVTQEIIDRVKAGDEDAKNLVYDNYYKMVYHLIHKYKRIDQEAEELTGIAFIGFMKALNSFNPSKGVKFATYMATCVTNEIFMSHRKSKRDYLTGSLEHVLSTDVDGQEITVLDVIEADNGDISSNLEENDLLRMVEDTINTLTTKQQKVVRAVYNNKGKQASVGEQIGISQSYVSRIYTKFLVKLDKVLLQSGIIQTSNLYKYKEVGDVRHDANKIRELKKLLKETDLAYKELAEQTGLPYATVAYHGNRVRNVEKKVETNKEPEVIVSRKSPEDIEYYSKPGKFPEEGVIIIESKSTEYVPLTEIQEKLPEVEESDLVGISDINLPEEIDTPKDLTSTVFVRSGYKVSTENLIAELNQVIEIVKVLGLKGIDFEVRLECN